MVPAPDITTSGEVSAPPALTVDQAYAVLIAALQAEAVRDGGDFDRAGAFLQHERTVRARWNQNERNPVRSAAPRAAKAGAA